MKKDFVSLARDYVKSECEKSTSKYGYEPFENHFRPVYEYSMILAEKVDDVDKEVLGIAAWMHDIGSIIKGREKHHKTGAEIARYKLEEWHYPFDKNLQVQHCILVHRGSEKFIPNTIEANLLIEADAMANFDNVVGIIKAAVMYEGLTQEQARKAVYEKIRRKMGAVVFLFSGIC